MDYLTFLPHYILILIELIITLFILIIISWKLWEWLVGKEVEERRIIENAKTQQ